jgi:hypothetical protein
VLLLGACGARGVVDETRKQNAVDVATAYLRAVAGNGLDRGWSLLHPDIQRMAFGGSFDKYITMATAARWDDFRWEVRDVQLDDPGLAYVSFAFAEGNDSIPGVLREVRQARRLWSIVNVPRVPAVDPFLGIRLDAFGNGRVWAGGG